MPIYTHDQPRFKSLALGAPRAPSVGRFGALEPCLCSVRVMDERVHELAESRRVGLEVLSRGGRGAHGPQRANQRELVGLELERCGSLGCLLAGRQGAAILSAGATEEPLERRRVGAMRERHRGPLSRALVPSGRSRQLGDKFAPLGPTATADESRSFDDRSELEGERAGLGVSRCCVGRCCVGHGDTSAAIVRHTGGAQ